MYIIKLIIMENITLDLLKIWKEKPSINPITNRKIKINGPTYKKIDKIYKSKFRETMSVKTDNSVKTNNSVKIKKRKLVKPNRKTKKSFDKPNKKSKIESEIIENYIEFRLKKIDPILVLELPLFNQPIETLFAFPYKWNPYSGERSNELDSNGPLYFDPNSLINYFYTNRLNNLWNNAHIDQYSNYTQGYYGDGVGNGPDFYIESRGYHKDWYLFRLPIIDEYLRKDHCQQSVTMGPKLTDKEVRQIYMLSKKYGNVFRTTFGYRRPNLIKIKKLYDKAISKNEQIDKILGDSIPEEEIKIIKFNTNIEAVTKLKNM